MVAVMLAAVPLAWADPWPSVTIPLSNARDLRAAAPRPPPGDVSNRARALWQAIQTAAPRDANAALAFFLPREPFLAIKDMSGADRYFGTLVRAFRTDINRYHNAWSASAHGTFVRFDLSTACTWMAVGHEANRLPYWSCYHSRLVARADGREHAMDVRVMIHWGDHWYCTHLGPASTSSGVSGVSDHRP